MAVGDPLSKTFTYGKIEDMGRARLGKGVILNPLITPALVLDVINLGILKIANILNGLSTEFYGTKIQTLTLTGSANPYTVDLTAISPFLLKIRRVVHVTTGGTRTLLKRMEPEEAEGAFLTVPTSYASSAFYVNLGDSLEVRAGTSFTITTASDKIHLYYFRQPVNSGATRTSKVDLLDIFVPYLEQYVVAVLFACNTGKPLDDDIDANLENDIKATWNSIGTGKAVGER